MKHRKHGPPASSQHHRHHQNPTRKQSHAHPVATGPRPLAIVSLPPLSSSSSSSFATAHTPAAKDVKHDRVIPGFAWNLAVKQSTAASLVAHTTPSTAVAPAAVLTSSESVIAPQKPVIEDGYPAMDETLVESLKGKSWYDIAEEEQHHDVCPHNNVSNVQPTGSWRKPDTPTMRIPQRDIAHGNENLHGDSCKVAKESRANQNGRFSERKRDLYANKESILKQCGENHRVALSSPLQNSSIHIVPAVEERDQNVVPCGSGVHDPQFSNQRGHSTCSRGYRGRGRRGREGTRETSSGDRDFVKQSQLTGKKSWIPRPSDGSDS